MAVRWLGLAALALHLAGHANPALDVNEPRSPADVGAAVVLPEQGLCDGPSAFGLVLGEPVRAGDARIVQRALHWSGDVDVTEFQPPLDALPFKRFVVLRTPVSKRVVWVMGEAFYDTEAHASEAATAFARWYGQRLGHPGDPAPALGFYTLDRSGRRLTILATHKAVQVACESRAMAALNLQE